MNIPDLAGSINTPAEPSWQTIFFATLIPVLLYLIFFVLDKTNSKNKPTTTSKDPHTLNN